MLVHELIQRGILGSYVWKIQGVMAKLALWCYTLIKIAGSYDIPFYTLLEEVPDQAKNAGIPCSYFISRLASSHKDNNWGTPKG